MAVESVTYIDDFVATNPVGNTDAVSTLDNHIRNIKTGLLNTFPNITGAMTATQAELNNLDGYTGNTNDLNILSGGAAAGVTATEFQYLNGVTSAIQTQLDARLFASNNLSDLANAGTARTNLGLGSLAVQNTVNNGDWSGTDLAVANGGTGGSTAADARTNLGLGSLAVQSQIDETDIDWANSDGLTQFSFNEWAGTDNNYLDGGSDGTSWYTKFYKRVYIPANVNSLDGQVYMQRVGALGAAGARITIGGSSSTEVTTSSTSYTAVNLNALDVSALSGWSTVEIEYRCTVASTDCRAYVDSAALRFI